MGKKNSGLETRFKNRKIKAKSAGSVSEKEKRSIWLMRQKTFDCMDAR